MTPLERANLQAARDLIDAVLASEPVPAVGSVPIEIEEGCPHEHVVRFESMGNNGSMYCSDCRTWLGKDVAKQEA